MNYWTIPFDPRRVPYSYRLRLDGREFTMAFEWNFVAGLFTLTIRNPTTGTPLWRRPILWGTDALWGCTVPGLTEYALYPGDPERALGAEGITWHNADRAQLYLMRRADVPGLW